MYFKTRHGRMVLGDSLDVMRRMIRKNSVDLIVTSPPYALILKKKYGNPSADEYLDWFRPFAEGMKRVLKQNGSLVINIGGAWVKGQPTRSLYHWKLLIMLCEEYGFHLAQEFYWWNPAKMPSSAWTTVHKTRVKDAVECIWWLSPSPWPKADNKRVLQPSRPDTHSPRPKNFYPRRFPSGHTIRNATCMKTGAVIPPNLIALSNSGISSAYMKHCRQKKLPIHPARFPAGIPEYFIRMLTDKNDLVFDPFAGSSVTGAVAERLGRRWVCAELEEEYLRGAIGRFPVKPYTPRPYRPGDPSTFYKILKPGLLWDSRKANYDPCL